MCCGQKRSSQSNTLVPSQPRPTPSQTRLNLRQRPAPLVAAPAVESVSTAPPQAPVPLRYLKTDSVRVRGVTTGQSYEFSGPRAIVDVDPRDVPALLNTNVFRRA